MIYSVAKSMLITMASFKVVFCALLLVFGSTHLVLGQELILVPDTTSVEFGSTIFMTCVADYGDGNETTFSWSLNGITIDNNSANGFIISDTNVSRNDMTFMMSTLQVCSMGIDDVGQYSCTASNSVGNDTAAWNITIADSEEAELLVVSDSIILSRFGDTVSMACAASGFPPPRIAFHKDGVNINDAGSDFITVNHTTITGTTGINYTLSTVQICNVGVNEIGLYSCTASNGVGSPHTLCWSLTPELSSPDIVTSPIDQVVEFSSTVNMTCVVNGYPFPKIVFSKDGETVDTNGATITEGVVIDQISRMASYQSVLTVYNIRQNELGIYSCTATNDHGNNSVSWKIMFPRVSNPAELIIVPDKVRSVEYGSTVLIPCVYDGYPQSEILFTKNDTPIINSMSENVSVYQRTISLHGINRTLSILEICSIRIDDIGEYTCTVSNALGNQSYSWSIVFTRDPEPTEILIVPSNNHSVDHGSTIILGCVAYGLPLPEIFWLRDDTLLTTSASNLLTINREILTEEGIELKRSFLEVCGLSEEDSGMYTCQAINPLATKTFDFELDVLPAIVSTITEATTTEKVEARKTAAVIGGVVGGTVAAVIVCMMAVILTIAIVVYLKMKALNRHPQLLIGSQEGNNSKIDINFDKEKIDLSFENPLAIEEGLGSTNTAL